jgi:hypothetical protein
MTNNDLKVVYPAHNGGGGTTTINKFATAHIMVDRGLLCHGNMDELLKKAGADKWVVRSGVIPGYPIMCEKCKENYKTNPDYPYKKWVESVKEIENG